MATVKITAMHTALGPSIPSPLSATVVQRDLFDTGRPVGVLILSLGSDSIEVWPADPVRIRELRDSLTAVVAKLEKE
jgi:hypothetical protein